MEIAVVGTPEFTLGFQLAGVNRLYHPEDDEALANTMRDLLTQKDVGIVVLDSANLTRLSDRLRSRIADSITPTGLGIGTVFTLFIVPAFYLLMARDHSTDLAALETNAERQSVT